MPDDLTNWNYWQCPTATPPAAFGPFAGMVARWQNRRPDGGGLPPRSSFDFPDFRGWWGRVAIVRIDRDPFDVHFTLWGTQLTDWWGTDYTGRQLGAGAKDPDAWLRTEGRYFQAMADAPFIGVASGGLDQHARPYISVVGLDLPLGEAGGLTHVLAIHMQITQGAAPTSVMPDCPMLPFVPGQ